MSEAELDSLAREGRFRELLAALDREEAALGEGEGEARARLQTRRLEPLRMLGEVQASTQLAAQLLPLARERGWKRIVVESSRSLGQGLSQLGQHEAALRLLEDARDAAQALGDPALVGEAWIALGDARERCRDTPSASEAWAAGEAELRRGLPSAALAVAVARRGAQLQRQGQLAEAEAALLEALRLAEGSPVVEAQVRWSLGMVLEEAGRRDRAIRELQAALRVYRGLRLWHGVGQTLNALGELARRGGRLEEADHLYLQAQELGLEGDPLETAYRANRALVALAQGEGRLARQHIAGVESSPNPVYAAVAAGVGMAAAALLGEGSAWAEAEGRLHRLLGEHRIADRDLAECLELAGRQVGDPARGARALALALEQYLGRGRPGDAERVRALLADLGARGAPIPLGPYELRRPLGAGSLGVVWEAVHRDRGVGVAVKLLPRHVADKPVARAILANEVRAVAAIAHPNVVAVLDQGRVGPAAHAMSEGRLAEGSPTLVMELARGGNLLESCGAVDWPQARSILESLLSALGAAHARGLIHRDIKPDNVLVQHPDDARPGVKLTDFGLARAIGEADARIAGTPAYMAPEQCVGRWRAVGPWTDLYSLGCLAWALLTGAPPLDAPEAAELMRLQQEREPGVFAPRCAVPPGTEAWLRRLMAKDPRARFGFAADARRALLALDGVGVAGGFPAWREAEAPFPLDLAGLDTWTLREIPMVGRESEREALWALLRAGAGRAVIRGGEGLGRTRLAEWLRVRAHELGLAEGLRVADGDLAGALSRAMRWRGLGGVELEDAIRGAGVESELARPLAALLEEAEVPSGERAAALAAGLRALAGGRPLILVLDDADRWPGLLDLARRLVELDAVPGLLTVLVLGAGSAPEEARPVLEGALVLELGPLDDAQIRRLLRSRLRLEEGLARSVARRCAGNPQLAVELVGSWIRGGSLELGRDGFALRPGLAVEVPAQALAIWERRVEQVGREHGQQARFALEILAVLGMSATDEEWWAANKAARVSFAPVLADRLEAEGLLRRRRSGWELGHGLLREALLRGAGARRKAWNLACSSVVREPALRGSHLAEAGLLDEAVEPLLAGARASFRRGELHEARGLLESAGACLDRLPAPAEDPRRGLADTLSGLVDLELGRSESAQAALDRVIAGRSWAGWERSVAEAVRLRARLARSQGRLGEAEALFEEALSLARALDEKEQVSQAMLGLALVLRSRGRVQAALELLLQARELLPPGAAELPGVEMSVGAIHLQLGDLPAARTWLARAVEAATRGQSRATLALSLNVLAEVDRKSGDLAKAEAGYEASLRILTLTGARAQALFPRMNLALIWLVQERWREARDQLLEVVEDLDRQGREGLAGACHAMLLAPLFVLGDLRAFDRHAALALEKLQKTGFREPDTLACLRQTEARVKRDPARAALVDRLLATQTAAP